MIVCYKCGQEHPRGTAVCPGCHTPLHIVGYQIQGVLGEGGCGAVYQAVARPTAAQRGAVQVGQEVALKQNSDPAGFNQLQREFSLLRRLAHPHLPRYYEIIEAGGHSHLIMELVPGQNLEDVLRKHPGGLIESQVLSYALQLCDVLSYLHGQTPPIVHRDIKPANIRLTPDGLLKLVDFGLFKEGGGQTRMSVSGLGTPEYAPLEQYGRGQGTDARSDIYSLGATFYHLLTGHIPDDAITRATAMRDPLRSPQAWNPQISLRVAEAILRALSLKPEDRFAGVEQFRAALLGLPLTPDAPATTRPALRTPALDGDPERTTHLAAPEIRKKTGWLPAVAITEATAGDVRPLQCHRGHTGPVYSVAFSADGGQFATGEADGSALLWQTETGKQIHRWHLRDFTNPVRSVVFAPDKPMLASAPVDDAGRVGIALWGTSDGRLVQMLEGVMSAPHSLAFSPDGTLLAAGDVDRNVFLWSIPDGHLLPAVLRHDGWIARTVHSVAFHPNGSILASAGADKTIRLWRVPQGKLIHTLSWHRGAVHSVAFAPDGEMLASGSADKTIVLWRVSDGAYIEALYDLHLTTTSVAFAPNGEVLASGGADGKVALWSVRHRALIHSWEGHTAAVTSLAFSPDSRILASASADTHVQMWGVEHD